jgi:predicted RecB family endonuclease
MLTLENNLRTLVLSLLEKPVNLMRNQHESLEVLKDIGRKNQRRIHELEFAVHKFTRCMSMVDNFDSKVNQVESKIEMLEV